MRNSGVLATALLFGCFAGGAHAAQQCFSQAGTYGSLTITENGTGCIQADGPRYGISDWAVISNSTCNFNISPPVAGANIKVRLGNINPGEVVSFALNGSPYAVQAADLDNTTTPPTPAGTLSLSGTDVIGNASGGDDGGNGIVSFGNAPSLVSSVTIAQSTPPGFGALLNVCIDEPATPVVTAVPTLTEWAQYAMALMLLMFGRRYLRSQARSRR